MVLALFDWALGIIGPTRYEDRTYFSMLICVQKNFVPKGTKYALYPQELVLEIMTHVPLERAREILYKNGEMDPRLVSLEVEIYQCARQDPGVYVGYYKDGSPIVMKLEGAEPESSIPESIVVDASKGGK